MFSFAAGFHRVPTFHETEMMLVFDGEIESRAGALNERPFEEDNQGLHSSGNIQNFN